MPDAVPHLGMLDGDDYPLGVLQDMSILPRSGRESDITGLGFDGLPVGVGLEVTCVDLCAVFLVADLVAVGIVRFSLHVTPHITDLPTEATPSKSYFA